MLGLASHRQIYARARPTDLRKGFNGLAALAQAELKHDLLEGDICLFLNRRRSSVKILLWDGTGLCLFSKQLANGRFPSLWAEGDAAELTLTRGELSVFLEGIKLEK